MEYLECIYDNRKSFYKKAKVINEGDKKILISYSTPVCAINDDDIEILWDGWSQTTSRHINEFLQQNGYEKMSKKDIIKNYEEHHIY